MPDQLHLEAMKEENASIVQANRELVVYCSQLHAALKVLFDDYKSLADSGDAGNWRIEDEDCGKQALQALEATPQQSLSENNACVIEKLLYDCSSPDLAQTNIREALQVYADKLRANEI